MKQLLVAVVVIEIFIIIFLGIRLKQKNNTLGAISINPLKNSDINFNPQEELKYFYEPKPNLKQIEKLDWLEHTVINTINSDALNERHDYSIDKPQDVYRIITLGDSFTFGAHVNTENNWTELLEARLNQKQTCRDINKFEVINLGVPGYDIQYAIERYKLRGKKYNPDLILWFLKNDDFYDIAEETQPIIKTQREKAKKEWAHDELVRGEDLAMLAQWTDNAIQVINKKYGKEKIMSTQKNLLEEFLYNINVRGLIFSMDDKNNAHLSTTEKENAIIHDIIMGNDDFFYTNQLFAQYDYIKDSFYPFDSHFNEKGHVLVADELFHYLIQKNIITCEQWLTK